MSAPLPAEPVAPIELRRAASRFPTGVALVTSPGGLALAPRAEHALRARGPHRYFFGLHAVDAELELARGAGRYELERALEGHVLATAELMGRYER